MGEDSNKSVHFLNGTRLLPKGDVGNVNQIKVIYFQLEFMKWLNGLSYLTWRLYSTYNKKVYFYNA